MITLGGLDRQRVRHALGQGALDLVAIARLSGDTVGRWPVAYMNYAWPGLQIVHTALFPKRGETSIANAVVPHRKYYDCIPQCPPILLGPVAAKNAFVLGDRLHWSQLHKTIDARRVGGRH
jgi:hypothetical protein